MAWLRHPLRIIVSAAAVLCLAWPLTSAVGVVASGLGVAIGVLLGEVVGRSQLKASAALGGCAALLGCSALFGYGTTELEFVASALGPALALKLGVLSRFGAFALFPVAALRLAALRRPALVFLELALSVSALAYLFASHRGGVVARPLWLGDWAWRAGFDPVVVLLAIGAGSFVLLAAILATEHGRRASAISVVALPGLALLVLSLFNVQHLPKPKNEAEQDLPGTAHGEPPRNPLDGPKVDAGQPSPKPREGEGGGQGQQAAGGGQGQQNAGGGPGGGQGQQNAGGGQGGGQGPQAAGGGQGGGQDKQRDGARDPQQQEQDGGPSEPPPPQEQPLDSPPPPDSQQEPAPMAIVLLGDDYTPPAQMYYLRQESWSQFAENRLVATSRPDVDRDVPSEYPTSAQAILDAPPQKGRKRVRAKVVMVVPHKKPFALETPVVMAPAGNPDPKRFVRAYHFEALAQATPYGELVPRRVGNPSWSKDVRDYYTLAARDPRFAALAKDIVAKMDEKKRALPFLQALAIKMWMDQNLTYSTRHRHAGVPDPAADFLFGDRIGYCVHFAHAAVFMWRSLGIPARVGMGYAVNAEAREGSALLVRSGDGHAWPELYLEGAGWVVLDISPKKNLDPPAKPPDKELQRKLSEIARQQPDEPLKEEKPGRLKAKQKLALPWRRIFAVLAAAIVLFLYATKLWRRVAPRFASDESAPRIGYRAALDMLSELGLQREVGETRESFARRLDDKLPTFGGLTAMHIGDYFGDPSRPIRERTECSKATWQSGLRQLRAELRAHKDKGKHSERWRALLGRLNPASFLASK